MQPLNKTTNSYARVLDDDVFARIPKAVFAAIAVSFATQISGEERIDEAQSRILVEWQILHDNDIVPQAPPAALVAAARAYIAEAEGDER